MASQHQHEQRNPHTIHLLTGAADTVDAVTGETYYKMATTLADAILQNFYAATEFDESCVAIEIDNQSTNGQYIRYSIDGGMSFKTLRAGQVREIDPWNTSKEPGKGFFTITRLMFIASAAGAHVEVTPHFGRG